MPSEKVVAVAVDDKTTQIEATTLPLPALPQKFTGTTEHRAKNYSMKVTHGNGYMAHIEVEATWETTPAVVFAIFTYPDNSVLFRDIKRVGKRTVVTSQPGFKVVEVLQIGEMRVLWMTREYMTWLRVSEDTRNTSLSITFELLKSDVLGRFNGRWDLHPIKDDKGVVTGCRGLFQQDVLPAGMPPFMAKIPVLGGLLRGAAARAIQRVMEDTNAAVDKVSSGMRSGKDVQHVLNELCGSCKAEAGYANGQVKSFQLGNVDDDEDAEDEDAASSAGLAAHIEVHDDESVGLHLIYAEAGAGVASAGVASAGVASVTDKM